jgi:hypothetical protein
MVPNIGIAAAAVKLPNGRSSLNFMFRASGAFELILEPAAGSLKIENYSTSHDAYSTARHFLNCI